MAKKKSSPRPNDFTDQQFVKEKCLFDDSKISDLLKNEAFKESAIIKAYDPSSKPDWISDEWICFPSLPFKLGFQYPFPAFTTNFFDITGLSYIQAMPMVWRVLWTLEKLIGEGGHQIDLSDLAFGYEVKSHGSNFYLLKTKQGMGTLILKTKHNDINWKRNFFFVKRSSIAHGKTLPKAWISKAINLSELAPPSPETASRFNNLLDLDPSIRSFGTNIFGEESAQSAQQSLSMSTETRKSNKQISFDDVTSLISAAGIKRERASPQIPKLPTGESLKSSSPATSLSDIPASKRNKTLILDDSPYLNYTENRRKVDLLLQQMDTCLSSAQAHNHKLEKIVQTNERLAKQRAQVMDEQERKLKELKDEVTSLKDAAAHHHQEMEDLVAQHSKALEACFEEATSSSAIFVLKDRLQIVREAKEKGADVSMFEVEAWEKALANLQTVDEPKQIEAGDEAEVSKGAGADDAEEAG